MALSGAEMLVRVAATLPDKTGKSLEEWVAEVGKTDLDPLDQSAVRQWLKSEHNLTKPQQEAIAIAVAKEAGWAEPTADDHLAAQYAGPKQSLRPIYDAVLAAATELGDDVVVEVRAGFVAVNRKRQFAAVQPATASRIDLGLRFVDPPSDERLKPAKAPGQSTHKTGLTAADQVDDGIRALLRQAYEQN
jgi:predicted transport protein